MPGMTPVPEGVRRLLGHNTHPGLMLDKYVESWDPAAQPGKLSERVQRPAVEAVAGLSRQTPPGFDLARRLGVEVPEGSCAGGVIFHDAWPEGWPPLTVDILNNHHAGYYQKGEPPGDWDSPIPVYFLSVPAGQGFTFALGKRREDV